MKISRLLPLLPVAAVALLACTAVSCSHNAPAAQTPAAHAPANVAGTWTWAYDGGETGQAITHTYVIKQNGETLTGTFQDTYDETVAEIKDGIIKGDQVSFSVARPLMGSSIDFTFTGKLEGNTITGKATWSAADQPTSADWVAKRGS